MEPNNVLFSDLVQDIDVEFRSPDHSLAAPTFPTPPAHVPPPSLSRIPSTSDHAGQPPSNLQASWYHPQVQPSSRSSQRGARLGSSTLQSSVTQTQPPPLPRRRNIPLPDVSSPPKFAPELALHIDLRIPLQPHDISLLSSVTIPPHVTEVRVEGLGHVHIRTQRFTAFDVIQCLQNALDGSVSLSSYNALSPGMQVEVEKAFMCRMWSTRRHTELWSRFLQGHVNPDGPMGVDLLLGKTYVTTLGPAPGSGEWRVIVVRPATQGQITG